MFECCVDNLNSRRQHHNWSGDDTITLVSGWSWWCQPKEDQQWWSLSALCQRHACCSAHWVRLVTWSNIWDSHDKVRIRERIAVFCFYCLFFYFFYFYPFVFYCFLYLSFYCFYFFLFLLFFSLTFFFYSHSFLYSFSYFYYLYNSSSFTFVFLSSFYSSIFSSY